MESKKVDVLVLGAGIVGMSIAHELQRAGRQVTVVDRAPEAGLGCSYGNAGWITPCFSMPLPQPGMFWKSIGWLLDPESPLYIKPQPSWLLVRWMLGFLRAMNQRQLNESVSVRTEISKYSLDFYRALAARGPDTCCFAQKGLLLVSGNETGLKAAEIEMRLMAERGVPGRLMTGEEIVAMEPSLKPKLKGGVYFPSEAHAEPLATVKALTREIEQAGGILATRSEIYDFEFDDSTSNSKVKTVFTTRGNYSPDLVVFALGAWSVPLARRMRVSVPLLGGKGYRLICDNMEVKPQHPIMIVERKIAVTPRGETTSLAGTLELVDRDEGITVRRVNAILRGSQEYLNVGDKPQISEIWRGLRPCTPDGVPMIGFSKKHSNLFYSVGHQMLGLQSAPGSAKLAADLIAGRASSTDPKPFRPERYE
ncbi:MAG: FAD-dependent oxidoreductase [Bdellovibrionota bacterium]